MIFGHIKAHETYGFLMHHPVWKQAFDWLRLMPTRPADGIHQLRGEDMYVNVMRYHTLPREQCRFESHRCYVDLQFTIEQAEIIECECSSVLEPDQPYDQEKDIQFYRVADGAIRAHMLPGSFSIFFPSDAHRPKIADGIHGSVFKLVIKIGLDLIQKA
jgi:YhcH/YjgK/YiaL family protein